MKIDVFKLNQTNRVPVDEVVEIPSSYYEHTEIREIKNCRIVGEIRVGYEEEFYVSLQVSGVFILPCAITLEDVPYDFSTEFEENIGNFDDFYNKMTNSLDIFPIIWENIISEVPIRVVKEGVSASHLNGEFWEVKSD